MCSTTSTSTCQRPSSRDPQWHCDTSEKPAAVASCFFTINASSELCDLHRLPVLHQGRTNDRADGVRVCADDSLPLFDRERPASLKRSGLERGLTRLWLLRTFSVVDGVSFRCAAVPRSGGATNAAIPLNPTWHHALVQSLTSTLVPAGKRPITLKSSPALRAGRNGFPSLPQRSQTRLQWQRGRRRA